MSAPIDERWMKKARELIVARCVHDGARANQCVECIARALAAARKAALEEAARYCEENQIARGIQIAAAIRRLKDKETSR